MGTSLAGISAGHPERFVSDAAAPVVWTGGEGDRRSLRWWIVSYLTTFATGAPTTLRYKKEDLELFYSWFVWAFGTDDAAKWNRASSNAFVQTLAKEKVKVSGMGKTAGEPRWSARSLNRKIDHLLYLLDADDHPAVAQTGDEGDQNQNTDHPSLRKFQLQDFGSEVLDLSHEGGDQTQCQNPADRPIIARMRCRPQQDGG